MTPEDFKEKMEEIFTTHHADKEQGHWEADMLMCDLLEGLGYKEGVEIFLEADKWWA